MIKKRDGREVEFDADKIVRAIYGAFTDIGRPIDAYATRRANAIAAYVRERAEESDAPLGVEEIQDLVERGLMGGGTKDVARQYISYRNARTMARETPIDSAIMELLDGESEYWNRENSNKNAKWVTTQRDYMAGIVSKHIARKYIFPEDAIAAHEQGIIHIHDMDYVAQHTLHNCFRPDTEFVTSNGVKKFADFYDGSPVVVRDKDGVWRSAVVHCFGNQALYTVTLRSGKSKATVHCTRNHRWVLSDGRVTDNLQVGDILYPLPDVASGYVPQTIEEIKAFCYGLVIGSGADKPYPCVAGIYVQLCGQDREKYAKYFEQAGYLIQDIPDTDAVVAINKSAFPTSSFLESQGWKLLPTEQKIALFNGYYAAEEHVDSNMVHVSDDRVFHMIYELAPVAGYYIANVRHDVHVTLNDVDSSVYVVWFRKRTGPSNHWKVEDIQRDEGSTSDVWCVTEPVTHTFTLANGIVTGNCELINLNDMLQNGTVVNGVRIERPHRILTATTIATQIIAAVASSSYGGATITLTHLAPFVRESHDRYLKKYKSWGIDDEKAEEFAQRDLKKEVRDAVQTLTYQLNSLTTTNGQSPFISVTMYMNETDEYKPELAMLIEEVLRQRIDGLKNRKGVPVTPAFPKLLYVLEEDNVREGTPYWYLTELAAKCTAKRMVPDYISEKKMTEYRGGCWPSMGCRSFLTPDTFSEKYGNIANAGDYKEGQKKYYGRLTR